MSSYEDQITTIMKEAGVKHFGFKPLETPFSMTYYTSWLKSGFAGTMSYLHKHEELKQNPNQLMHQAQSAIVVGIDYIPHPEPNSLNFSLKTARYAQGSDYHFWLKQKLDRIILKLQHLAPSESFSSFTDSAPILERDLAFSAGLGWVGKNTCLIDQKRGSFFLIGEILTSLTLTPVLDPAEDRCGNCTRCIDACPTQALMEPRKLDARKCISYLTIESKALPPLELRNKMGDHYFGCDICQTVCPWNQKVFKTQLQIKPSSREDIVQDLKFILNASNRQITNKFAGSPLLRAPAWAHKRNALVVIANLKIIELKDEVEKLCSNERLKELAIWSLNSLSSL